MPYLLVPHDVSSTTATIWLSAADLPRPRAGSLLEYGEDEQTLDAAGWRRWSTSDGQRVLHYRAVTLRKLEADRQYRLAWRVDGEVQAHGEVRTLPERLPGIGETPLTVLLGSCFAVRRDQEGRAGTAYFHLPYPRRPVLKFLCGDQVYLDDPAFQFLRNTYSARELEHLFFENYLATWGQPDRGSGLNQVLTRSANYFTPDDHELWNNAPNFATLIRTSWSRSGREAWKKAATALYRIFQTDRLLTPFKLGRLSFMVVDTRMERASGSRTFLPPAEMKKVGQWIHRLQGPGVLVIGQPVFSRGGGWFSQTWIDRELPDYEQYADLVRHLASSRHSIVILTGDVHYGRLAQCRVRADLDLVEVISSPMALVDEKVGRRWSAAPEHFPARSVPDAPITPQRITTHSDWNRADDHFVTVEFTEVGTSVRMQVRDWRIAQRPVEEAIGTPIDLR
jgi:phosphodiesterase/alkaline phosphatase D-like protein